MIPFEAWVTSARQQEVRTPSPARETPSNVLRCGKARSCAAQREWSQADLAERVHVSRQTINSIERGKYDPSLSLAFKIAKVFDVSIEKVFLPDEPRRSVR